MSNQLEPSSGKILLAMLPYWTPLLPPQGILRLKTFLQEYGCEVKTLDANIGTVFKQLYDDYFNCLKSFIPVEKQGNFYNIGNDVWREHMMAHIHYTDEEKYVELVKILVHRVFYAPVDEVQVRQLNDLAAGFFRALEEYWLAVLEREQPEVLGLTVYRDTLPASMFIFRLTRERYPHIRTVMGGGIFTIQLVRGSPNFEAFLERTRDYIDCVMIGGGELLMLEWLRGNLPEGRRVYSRQDIGGRALGFSGIRLPDTSDFDLRYYNYLAVQGSASCPNQCSFCNVAAFYGEYKMKPAPDIVAEMRQLHDRYGLQLVHMLDALLNPVVDELSARLSEAGLSFYWDGYFRVDPIAADMERVMRWRRGGYYRARIGVESGSQRILDLMGKEITVEQTRTTIMNLARAGIKTTAYIVIGHPGETEEDFQRTLDLVEQLRDYIWEAECNPFTYFYHGQSGNREWEENRRLLYPADASEMLVTQTWFVDVPPAREEMYRRVNRFVEHCRRLGVNIPWSLDSVNKSDERWKRLHANAVPPVTEFIKRNNHVDENKYVQQVLMAEEVSFDEGEFDL